MLVVPARIGAGLRLEGGFDVGNLRAQLAHHRFQNMVFRNAQKAFANLHGHMPIPQVVSDLGQFPRRRRFDMQHLLRLRNDFDDSPVRGRHQIPAAQDLAARQDQADLLPGFELRLQAALLPRFERQPQRATHLELVCASGHPELISYFQHE